MGAAELDHYVPHAEGWLLRNFPVTQRLLHSAEFAGMEALGVGFRRTRILRAIQRIGLIHLRMSVRGWASIDVQQALRTTVYNAGGCSSYYLDVNGRNSFSWQWSTVAMTRRLIDGRPWAWRSGSTRPRPCCHGQSQPTKERCTCARTPFGRR
nr:hypothetical protein [Kibdelosporangium sp. MJ126-NF4]CTQ95694.1 Cyclohexanone monooxygenase (EC 1.14.13.22) [Kibdelosporangium sp. MJ126-NF4]